MLPHLQLVPDHVLEAIQHQAAQQAEEGQREAEGTHEAIAKACSMVSSSGDSNSQQSRIRTFRGVQGVAAHFSEL